MPDNTKVIILELKEVTKSLNSMQAEYAGLKTEHRATAKGLSSLGVKVDELNNSVIRLEGKSKGLRADVQRVETSVAAQISDLKKEDIPLIVDKECSQYVRAHEDRYRHSKTWINTPSRNPKPANPTVTMDSGAIPCATNVSVPKWLFYVGIFFGVAAAGGGIVLVKYLF